MQYRTCAIFYDVIRNFLREPNYLINNSAAPFIQRPLAFGPSMRFTTAGSHPGHLIEAINNNQ